jgi:flagellin
MKALKKEVNGMSINGVDSSSVAMQSLSSGLRINSAADDPAGLAISEKMRAQINGDSVATRNMRDSQSMLKTAEGGLNASTSVLQRMRELSIQANNSLLTDSDRSIIQQEFSHLVESLNAIGKNTEFNTQKLLDGSLSNHQTTTNANGDSLSVTIDSALANQLGNVDSGQTISSIDLVANPGDALKIIDTALGQVSESRSSIGAKINRLDYAVNVSENKQLNLSTAESRIRDADIAQAIMNQNRNNILQQTYLATQKMQYNVMGQVLNLFG